ncbi:MAG: hypothetical protein ACREKL_00540 [Chthoniobacterales bacterium]
MKFLHRWNKAARACGFAVLAWTGQMLAAPEPQALVVLRHGESLDVRFSNPNLLSAEWKRLVPGWPTYAVPNNAPITLQTHGLSPAGETQAFFLRANLRIIMRDLGCAQITRVVTMRPFGEDEKNKPASPNPFDTIYPYLKSPPAKELILINPGKGPNPIVDRGLARMLDPKATREDSIFGGTAGSVLLCWDGEGLWGEKVANGTRPWNKDSILSILGGPDIGAYIRRMDKEVGGGFPDKGSRLYVFLPREGTGPGTKEPRKYNCIILDVLDASQIAVADAVEITARLTVDEDTKAMRILWPEVGGRDPWKPMPGPTP